MCGVLLELSTGSQVTAFVRNARVKLIQTLFYSKLLLTLCDFHRVQHYQHDQLLKGLTYSTISQPMHTVTWPHHMQPCDWV